MMVGDQSVVCGMVFVTKSWTRRQPALAVVIDCDTTSGYFGPTDSFTTTSYNQKTKESRWNNGF